MEEGRREERGRTERVSGEVGGWWGAGSGPSAGMNTESNSRLSHRRMSHLARHCAVNETERGGTPAERGF